MPLRIDSGSGCAGAYTFLGKGIWPTRGEDMNRYPEHLFIGEPGAPGTPLADGWFALLFLLRADLEFLSSALDLENCNSLLPCYACGANTIDHGPDARPWTDFSTTAASITLTLWTQLQWLEAHPQRHRVLRLPGVGVCNVSQDVMHTKHGGTDAYFYGSVLKYMTHHWLAGTIDRNLKTVWAILKSSYSKDVSAQYGHMTITMYDNGPSSFPCLKGKCSMIRHFGAPLLATMQKLLDDSGRQPTQEQRWMLIGMRASVRMEAILEEEKDEFVLSPAAGAEFKDMAFRFLAMLSALRCHFGVLAPLFHITIKVRTDI